MAPEGVGTFTVAPRAASHGSQRQIQVDIGAIHPVLAVRAEFHFQVQVAGLSATVTRTALTGQAYLLALADAPGDTHLQGPGSRGDMPVCGEFRDLQRDGAGGALVAVFQVYNDLRVVVLATDLVALPAAGISELRLHGCNHGHTGIRKNR